MIDGVILNVGDAKINNSYFENNSGTYGGAISSLPVSGFASETSLIVENSEFVNNLAYAGGAIYVGAGKTEFAINNCIFVGNNATGIGSYGYTSAGGAVSINRDADGTIVDSKFYNNSATVGGAVDVSATKNSVKVTIDNCDFENNTATGSPTREAVGGAIRIHSNSLSADKLDVTVTNSNFTDNVAGTGSAIYNNGTLSLSGNKVFSDKAEIVNGEKGTIPSTINVVVLDGEVKTISTLVADLNATVTDDNGNLIEDAKFNFTINGVEVPAVYNAASKLYEAVYTLPAAGIYPVNITYVTDKELVVVNGTIKTIAGTYTDLQAKIDAAGGSLVLPYNFTYTPGIDGVNFPNGVLINKDISIDGNGFAISGNNSYRIFNVADNAVLTLSDVTLIEGNATNGGAVYVNAGSTLNANNVAFDNNTAKYRGGAIYSEGTVNIDGSSFDSNNITYRKENVDYGGAAIANMGGTLNIDHSRFTNDLRNYVVRTGDANNPQFVDAVVLCGAGSAVINNSYFENNSGTYGGSIAGVPLSGDVSLTVENSDFVNNLAYCGAGVYVGSGPVEFSIVNCTFIGNNATGIGSYGYTSAGAAICVARGAHGTIKDSKFINNTATVGGAIDVSATKNPESVNVVIDNCTFENNTAVGSPTREAIGGAIRLNTAGMTITVKNSNFTDNNGVNGSAIYNGATLTLSGNKVFSDDAEIVSKGIIVSTINVVVLDGEVKTISSLTADLFAKVTDDKGNLIEDGKFNFTINGVEVPAVYNVSSKLYEATYTLPAAGIYPVNITYVAEDKLIVVNGTIKTVKGTYTDLLDQINKTAAGETLVLPYDFIYTEEIDGENFPNGVVIDKAITIDGNGTTISGNNSYRIFDVTTGILTLGNVTLTDGNASNGGAVYVVSGATLNADNVNFTDNSATYRGGAIWSAGTVNIDNAWFDSNNITYRKENVDYGGAAIYSEGTLSVDNSRFTNDLTNYIVRTGDANNPQLIDAVVLCGKGSAVINNSYFENNSGTYGGAIAGVPVPSSAEVSLIVENSEFVNNLAYCGAAIYVGSGSVEFAIDNCTFIGNNATGIGSYGYTSAGGAICIARGAHGTIEDSKFINNTATVGGAIDVSATMNPESVNVVIDNCTFENNTAVGSPLRIAAGGAIRLNTAGTTVTVMNSNFTNNKGDNGSAIYNVATLTLSNNIVFSDEAEIESQGIIVSTINVKVLDGEVKTISTLDADLFAEVTDDNGNLIKDGKFNFTINGVEVPAVYNASSKLYEATYALPSAGIYPVNITYVTEDELVVVNGTIKTVKGTYTDLQNLIDAAQGTLVLPYDFIYTEEIDGENFPNGVVIDKAITIDGNGTTISGNNSYRIFDVTTGILTLGNVTLTDGNASNGGAVYVVSGATLNADNVNFTDNSATYRGGAIWSAGTVNIDNAWFDSNNITYRKENVDYGGAAIYSEGTLSVDNSRFTNDLTNYIVRTGDANNPQLIDAVVLCGKGSAVINNSYFENNSGTYGGAIAGVPVPSSAEVSLIVENSEFVNNLAYCGAAIYVGSGSVEFAIDNCTFIGNNATGIGSYGYTSAGGAICIARGAHGTIEDSKFINNTATVGGAIDVSATMNPESVNVVIDNCTFENNTAVGSPLRIAAGGAIRLNTAGTTVTVMNSNFTNNKGDNGSAIYNVATLTLSNNKVFSDEAEIENIGKIYSLVNATLNNNQTVYDKKLGDKVVVNATLTDDMGNAIYDPNFRIAVDGVAIENITYDESTCLYTSNYTIAHAGEVIVSTLYDADNLVINIGIYDVPKSNATLIVTVDEDKFALGDNVTVSIELWDKETEEALTENITLVIDNVPVTVEVIDGEATYNITGLEPGQHVVMGIFDGTINYNGPVYDSDAFTVLYPDRILSIEVEDIKYGDIAIINITVTDSEGNKEKGVVSLNVSGKEIVVIVDGNKSVEIEGLPVGEYLINATLMETEFDAEVINDTESFTVGQAASIVEIISVENATYPDDVIVTIKVENATEICVNITQNGAPVEVTVVVSEDTITISGLGVGEYTINVTNADSESYTGSSATALFNVSQATPVISVTAEDVTYDADVVVTVVSDASGTATVSVGGQTVTDTVEAGVSKDFIISGLAANEEGYAITVSLAATQNYTAGVNDTESVKVMKAASSVEIEDIADVTYNASVEVSYKLENGTVKNIEVYDAYGEQITADIDNSTAGIVIISGLNAGEYTIVIYNAGDENHTESDSGATFNVLKATATIGLEVTGDMVVDGEVNITFTVPKDRDGVVTVLVDGREIFGFTIDENGTCTIPGTYDAGEHIVTVSLTGDTNYEAVPATNTFNIDKVNPEITISDIAGNVGDTVEATVTIAGEDATGYVFFDGGLYIVENGQTTIPVVISTAGMQAITVIYTGDGKYNNGTGDKEFNAGKAASSVDIDGDKEITTVDDAVVIVTVGPEGVTGTVDITVDGEPYGEPVEVIDGVAMTEISGLTAGNHTIAAQYTGNYNYNASEIAEMNVTVSLAPTDMDLEIIDAVYGETAYVIVSGLPEDATGNVTVTIGDNTFTAPVEDGLAVVEITGLAADEYEFEVSYSGDDKYEAASDEDSIEITPAASSVEIDDIDDVVYNESVEVTYTVENETEITVAVYDADGTEITEGITLEDGKVIIAGLEAGEYTIAIFNAGDENHTAYTAYDSFNVLKDTVTIEPDATGDMVVDGEVNITFTVPKDIDGILTVTIDGELVEFSVDDGTVTITDTYSAGPHTVVVTLSDDTNYEDASGSTTFEINKVDPDVTASDLEFIVDNEGILEITGPSDRQGNLIVSINGTDYAVALDRSGLGTLDVSGLAEGTYTVDITYIENDKYNAGEFTDAATITVNAKADTPITVKDVYIEVGETATVNAVVPAAINGQKVTISVNGEDRVVTVKDGKASARFTDLTAGEYEITVSYAGDNANAANSTTATLTVGKVAPETSIEATSVVAGNDVIITVTVPEDAIGTVYFDVDGKNYYALVEDGEATLILSDLPVGNYTVEYTYGGDDKYIFAIGDAEFEVSANDTYGVDVFSEPALVGEDAVITVVMPEDATGEVAVTVEGKTYSAPIVDGVATIVIPDMPAGEFDADVEYAGDDKYAPFSAETLVIVDKVPDAPMDVEADPVEAGEDAVVEVTLPEDATGEVTVSVGGKNYTAPVKDGKATVTVPGLPAGDYTADVTYSGDDKYEPVSDTAPISVDKVSDAPIDAEAEPAEVGGDAVVEVTLPEDATGEVTVTVDGKDYTAPVKDGKATVTVPDLPVGNYPADVVYSGDDKYDPVSTKTPVTVNKVSDAPIDAESEPVEAGETATIDVTLPKDATGVVVAEIDGELYAANVENGTATISVPGLTGGNHTATVSYYGDDKYEPVNTTTTVEIGDLFEVLAPDVVKYYHGPERFNVYVLLNGEGVADKTVKITLNGVTYERTTDENGTASIGLNLNSGQTYNVTVKVDDIELNSTVTIKSTVIGTDVTKIYKNGTQYYATFYDREGNLLANTAVTFNINGVFYNRTTDANGVAKLNINLIPGEYIITALNPASGEMISNKVTVLSQFVEHGDLVKVYGTSVPYVLKVRGKDGSIAAGQVVNFNINGVFYNRTSDSNGLVRLNINLLPGEYIITATYGGERVSDKVTVLAA